MPWWSFAQPQQVRQWGLSDLGGWLRSIFASEPRYPTPREPENLPYAPQYGDWYGEEGLNVPFAQTMPPELRAQLVAQGRADPSILEPGTPVPSYEAPYEPPGMGGASIEDMLGAAYAAAPPTEVRAEDVLAQGGVLPDIADVMGAAEAERLVDIAALRAEQERERSSRELQRITPAFQHLQTLMPLAGVDVERAQAEALLPQGPQPDIAGTLRAVMGLPGRGLQLGADVAGQAAGAALRPLLPAVDVLQEAVQGPMPMLGVGAPRPEMLDLEGEGQRRWSDILQQVGDVMGTAPEEAAGAIMEGVQTVGGPIAQFGMEALSHWQPEAQQITGTLLSGLDELRSRFNYARDPSRLHQLELEQVQKQNAPFAAAERAWGEAAQKGQPVDRAALQAMTEPAARERYAQANLAEQLVGGLVFDPTTYVGGVPARAISGAVMGRQVGNVLKSVSSVAKAAEAAGDLEKAAQLTRKIGDVASWWADAKPRLVSLKASEISRGRAAVDFLERNVAPITKAQGDQVLDTFRAHKGASAARLAPIGTPIEKAAKAGQLIIEGEPPPLWRELEMSVRDIFSGRTVSEAGAAFKRDPKEFLASKLNPLRRTTGSIRSEMHDTWDKMLGGLAALENPDDISRTVLEYLQDPDTANRLLQPYATSRNGRVIAGALRETMGLVPGQPLEKAEVFASHLQGAASKEDVLARLSQMASRGFADFLPEPKRNPWQIVTQSLKSNLYAPIWLGMRPGYLIGNIMGDALPGIADGITPLYTLQTNKAWLAREQFGSPQRLLEQGKATPFAFMERGMGAADAPTPKGWQQRITLRGKTEDVEGRFRLGYTRAGYDKRMDAAGKRIVIPDDIRAMLSPERAESLQAKLRTVRVEQDLDDALKLAAGEAQYKEPWLVVAQPGMADITSMNGEAGARLQKALDAATTKEEAIKAVYSAKDDLAYERLKILPQAQAKAAKEKIDKEVNDFLKQRMDELSQVNIDEVTEQALAAQKYHPTNIVYLQANGLRKLSIEHALLMAQADEALTEIGKLAQARRIDMTAATEATKRIGHLSKDVTEGTLKDIRALESRHSMYRGKQMPTSFNADGTVAEWEKAWTLYPKGNPERSYSFFRFAARRDREWQELYQTSEKAAATARREIQDMVDGLQKAKTGAFGEAGETLSRAQTEGMQVRASQYAPTAQEASDANAALARFKGRKVADLSAAEKEERARALYVLRQEKKTAAGAPVVPQAPVPTPPAALVPPTAAVPLGKEPWQMTRAEYKKAVAQQKTGWLADQENSLRRLAQRIPTLEQKAIEMARQGQTARAFYQGLTVNERAFFGGGAVDAKGEAEAFFRVVRSDNGLDWYSVKAGTSGVAMAGTSGITEVQDDAHFQSILRRLAEGRDVPPHILAGYPELATPALQQKAIKDYLVGQGPVGAPAAVGPEPLVPPTAAPPMQAAATAARVVRPTPDELATARAEFARLDAVVKTRPLTKQEDDLYRATGDVITRESQATARVPFVRTQQMDAELARLGYTADEIAKMADDEAFAIITEGRAKATARISPLAGINPDDYTPGTLIGDPHLAEDLREAQTKPLAEALEKLARTLGDPSVVPPGGTAPMDVLVRWKQEKLLPDLVAVRQYALDQAQRAADVILLNYGDRANFDTILAQFVPFHFWQGRQLGNLVGRILEQPSYLRVYAQLKANEEEGKKSLPYDYQGMSTVTMPNGKERFFDLDYWINPVGMLEMRTPSQLKKTKRAELAANIFKVTGAPYPAFAPVTARLTGVPTEAWQRKSFFGSTADAIQYISALAGLGGGKGIDVEQALRGEMGGLGALVRYPLGMRPGQGSDEQIVAKMREMQQQGDVNRMTGFPVTEADIQEAVRTESGLWSQAAQKVAWDLGLQQPESADRIAEYLITQVAEGKITEEEARQAILDENRDRNPVWKDAAHAIALREGATGLVRYMTGATVMGPPMAGTMQMLEAKAAAARGRDVVTSGKEESAAQRQVYEQYPLYGAYQGADEPPELRDKRLRVDQYFAGVDPLYDEANGYEQEMAALKEKAKGASKEENKRLQEQIAALGEKQRAVYKQMDALRDKLDLGPQDTASHAMKTLAHYAPDAYKSQVQFYADQDTIYRKYEKDMLLMSSTDRVERNKGFDAYDKREAELDALAKTYAAKGPAMAPEGVVEKRAEKEAVRVAKEPTNAINDAFNRIAPGASFGLFGDEAVYRAYGRFYDVGRDVSKLTPAERGLLDKAVAKALTLKEPSEKEQRQWQQARDERTDFDAQVKAKLGTDILDLIESYNALPSGSQAKRDFRAKDPTRIQGYYDFRDDFRAKHPVYATYYGKPTDSKNEYGFGLKTVTPEQGVAQARWAATQPNVPGHLTYTLFEGGKPSTPLQDRLIRMWNAPKAQAILKGQQAKRPRSWIPDEMALQMFGPDILRNLERYAALSTKAEKEAFLFGHPRLRAYLKMTAQGRAA